MLLMGCCLYKGLLFITKYKNEGELYLQMYPKFEKWMNQCIICQSKGYKPEFNNYTGNADGWGAGSKNIRHYFSELSVNELGYCEQCQKIIK